MQVSLDRSAAASWPPLAASPPPHPTRAGTDAAATVAVAAPCPAAPPPHPILVIASAASLWGSILPRLGRWRGSVT